MQSFYHFGRHVELAKLHFEIHVSASHKLPSSIRTNWAKLNIQSSSIVLLPQNDNYIVRL